MFFWTLDAALPLIRQVEAIAPSFGAHVALTGGCLYKVGDRKDLDLMFYRIRQEPKINEAGLLKALEGLGFTIGEHKGWVTKSLYTGRSVDLFFPERSDNDGYR